MRLRLVAVAALLALAVTAHPAAARPRAAMRLHAFSSCETLIDYAGRHVPSVRRDLPPSTGPFAPDENASTAPLPALAPAEGGAGDDTSQTNVQEAGVDEPDTVKTDGRTIFALANGMLHAVDARSPEPELLGTLALDQGWGTTMLLRKGRAFVLGGGPDGARMTEADVSDPAHMRVLRTEDVDGYIVDARLTGRTARVVVASYPEAVYGPAELRALPSGWLPSSTLANARTGKSVTARAVGCRSVRRPAVFSGAGVLTVYTVDLAAGLPAVDADAIFASADTVYASPSSLYVATQRWDDGTYGANTSIHRFDTSDPDRTGYSASGAVPGTLLNQFAMSEDKGVLRTATTVGFGPEAESKVTTLDERAGHLVQRGQVGALGLGERIYAVRFIGDVGYVVTFRQTDPLYTLDLSDPDRPRVVGELKIPGYSAYLHPVGADLLLGVGQEATDDGRVQGLQLSLFDVSDLAHPTRLHRMRLGEHWSHSAAEWDHHAFLWWPATKLAVLPIDSADFTGAAGYRVDRMLGISELGRVSHANVGGSWTPSINRAVVVGPRLFTISDRGVKASGLESFAGSGWAAFPQPPEQPIPIDVPIAMPGGPVAID
jgi:uncharacterized secreted protein with C-terminal beta-propeller domain